MLGSALAVGLSVCPLKMGLSKICGVWLEGAVSVVAVVAGCVLPNERSKKLLSNGSAPELVVMTSNGVGCSLGGGGGTDVGSAIRGS